MSTLQVQVPEAYQIKMPLHQNHLSCKWTIKAIGQAQQQTYILRFLQQNRTNLLYWEAFLLWGRMKP